MSKQNVPRPRRTREHVIAAQSYNHIERFFIDKGHTVARPTEDYGFDVLVNTFDEDGYAENGEILMQLKASDRLAVSADGRFIAFKTAIRHLDLWIKEPMPVFLVLFDAEARTAFWLYVQEHFQSKSARRPRKGAKSVTLHVPIENEFSEATVDFARKKKALILAQIEGKISHHG